MSLEESIKSVIEEKLSDGTVERLVGEAIEKAINNALDGVFSWNSPSKKTLEAKLNEVFVPALEKYDYSRYVTKLDKALTDIIQNTNLAENKTILSNFQSLMTEPKCTEIKLSEIAKEWCKYVAENVDTDDLDVNYDDGVHYDDVTCELSIETQEFPTRTNSIFDRKTIILECEQGEDMNFIIPISRYKNDKSEGYDININHEYDISSLRYLSDFEIFLMKLERANVKVVLDVSDECYDVTPDKEPEPTYE